MTNDLPQKNQLAIQKLEKMTGITDVKLDRLTQDISEIKNNHLLHINDQLIALNQLTNTNQVAVTKLISDELGEVYSKLSDLKVSDARNEPSNQIVTKVIEYAILAIVAGGIAFLISKN